MLHAADEYNRPNCTSKEQGSHFAVYEVRDELILRKVFEHLDIVAK